MTSTKINVDKLLSDVGAFGRYQKFIYLLACVAAIFPASATLHTVFTASVPAARCLVPDCDDAKSPNYSDAFSHLTFANFAIPYDTEKGAFDGCHRYKEYDYLTAPKTSACNAEHFNQESVIDCGGYYVVDDSVYASTLVADFGLFCDLAYKVPLVESIFFMGVLIGAPAFGYAADYFGRKKTLLAGLICMCVFCNATALAPNFSAFAAFHFLGAMGQAGVFQTALILSVECVGEAYRVLCGVLIEVFFVLGEALVPLAGYLAGSWRATILWLMVPSLIPLLYWPLFPESPRWLLSRKKYVEAQRVVAKMAKYNRTSEPQIADYREAISDNQDNSQSGEGVMAWIRHPRLLLRTLNLCFAWAVITMAYYGLSMNSASLAGSPYINFLLVSLVEVPAYGLSYVGMQRAGRRPVMAASLIVGGAAILVSPAATPGSWINIVTFLVGKMGVTCAFGVVYLYTSELYPTPVRTAAVGFSSACARMGAILSPYVAALSATSAWLPMIIFGGSAVISGALALFLPETRGKELPGTIGEALRLSEPKNANVFPPNNRRQQQQDEIEDEADERTPLVVNS